MRNELQAIITIAFRDFIKLLRDRPRIIIGLVFPLLFIGALGGSLQANIGSDLGYNIMAFVFTGVFAQTMFQSTASGVISLIEDRENDFSQEIFVSPVSRYSIIIGKILGETMVSLVQGIGIILLGLILRIDLSISTLITMIPALIAACFLGGAFGLLVLSNLSSQRTANQVFPLLIFPQFILAGVFNPIKELPSLLLVLSRISPMTYAVDLLRSIYYYGKPEAAETVLFSPTINIIVMIGMFALFVVVGTYLFVKNEKNR